MKYLLALSILTVSVVLAGCGRGYNTSSTAYNRSYSRSAASSHRHHRESSRRGSGGGSHHHHHHDGDHGRGRH